MKRSTIGNIPIVNSIDGVQYYYDGDLGERWEVVYKSKSQLNMVEKEIRNYLTKKMVKLNSKSSCHNGTWEINNETIMMQFEYQDKCIMIYLDDNDTHVLVRALEMN